LSPTSGIQVQSRYKKHDKRKESRCCHKFENA